MVYERIRNIPIVIVILILIPILILILRVLSANAFPHPLLKRTK